MKTALQIAVFFVVCAGLVFLGGALVQVQDSLNALVNSHNELISDYNNLALAHNELADRYEALDATSRNLTTQYDAIAAQYERMVIALSPPVDAGSAIYDCDDATLDAFRFYTERDYPVCIVAGNLEMEHESRYQLDHVWLLVRFEGGWLPIDWGAPVHDCQHFKGYRLTLNELLREVEGDLVS